VYAADEGERQQPQHPHGGGGYTPDNRPFVGETRTRDSRITLLIGRRNDRAYSADQEDWAKPLASDNLAAR
jgi:hypothetical protein